MLPWHASHPTTEQFEALAIFPCENILTTFKFEKMSETNQAMIITPGNLEPSEETLTMEPFKKHPKGLCCYEQR